MKKIFIVLIILILILIYLFTFQKNFLRDIRDYFINLYTYFKVVNSNEYKSFSNSDKTKKYYISEKEIKIPILLYHEICDSTPDRQNFHLSTTTQQFRQQITDLKNLGYTFITYDNLIEYKNNNLALPEFCVLLTFDDGYRNVYENAFPIIKELNIPITIFIINSCIGTDNYISWDNAIEMDKSNLVSIYTHSNYHINYSEVSPSFLLDDITSSHNHIESQLGHSVTKVMAYPYGYYSEDEICILENNGFVQNILLDIPNTSSSLNMSKLTRIFVKQNYSVYTILDIIL